jgi:UDP:flavonoid glycosyltransferase YjiC (YdhE family)
VPPPTDWLRDHLVTGYWFLDEQGWKPPHVLQRFLSSGNPTLYIGFGSTGMGDDSKAHRATDRALRLSGLRAVVSSGGRDARSFLVEGTKREVVDGYIPHDWLFPRVTAVVHHGGAGTTAEGLRAGVPSIIFPTASDQHFWAQRIARLGAGPNPLSRGSLTPEAIAKLLVRAVEDPGMKERARRIGEKIRAESGVATAVQELLRIIDSGRLTPASSSRAGLPP